MFGARADNRTAFCAAKTWFAETAEKETFSDREVASKQRIAGTASAVEKMRNESTHPRRFHLSDILSDVCLCLVRERIIEPLVHCERKFIFPR